MSIRARLYSYYGGKSRMTTDIRREMPKEFITYIEPFFGSGAVFFSLEPNQCRKVIINDLDGDIIHFIRTLIDIEKGEKLLNQLLMLQPSEEEFKRAKRCEENHYCHVDEIQRAVMTYILISQSFNGLRTNFRRGMNKENYNKLIKTGVPLAREKLNGNVEIHNTEAIEIIRKYKDDTNAFIFIDSPYRHELRNKSSCKAYKYEMDMADHIRLLTTVGDAKAKIMLCGYHDFVDDLYDSYLLVGRKWTGKQLVDINKPSANRRNSIFKERAKEWIWINY